MEIKKKSSDDKKALGPSIADLMKAIEELAAIKTKRGERGDKGDKGDRGPRGEKGDSGERGERGYIGPQGERGESVVGPQGEKGERGERGEPGAIGKQGPRGPVGKAGADGRGIASIEQSNPDTFVIHYTDGTRTIIELPRGADGREIELRANGTLLQWRYTDEGSDDWRTLLDLKTLAGLQQQVGAGPVKLKLISLVDVDDSTLQDTYVLAWDAGSGKFIFVPNGSGGTDLEVQSDDTPVDDEVAILNFSSLFDISEAPAHKINIQLSGAVISALSLASTALQSGDNVSELVNDANYLSSVSAANLNGSALYTQSVINGYIVASVASNNLTIELKTLAGSDPSASDPVYIIFRNSTLTNGVSVVRAVTSSLSITVPSGGTLGHISGQLEYAFVYAIDNAGTVELAIGTHPYWDEGDINSNDTLALGTGSDSRARLYSTSARSNVPVRLLARLASTQATAGTWASAPGVWNCSRTRYKPYGVVRVEGGNGFGSTNTKIRRFSATVITGKFGDPVTNISYADSSTLGGSFTVSEHGMYSVMYGDGSATAGSEMGLSLNSSQLTTNIRSITASDRLGIAKIPRTFSSFLSWTGELLPGDIIRAHGNGVADSTGVDVYFEIVQLATYRG